MNDPVCATLVIGLGSPLMGDDGAGLAALEALREEWVTPPGVELIDGGTWGMNLLPMLEEADCVIFLDAVRGDHPSGTVTELVGSAIPHLLRHKLSPHQIDLSEVLALATLRGTLPRDLRVIGVEPKEVTMRTSLSCEVVRAIPVMVTRVVGHLEAVGLHCLPRFGEAPCMS